MLDGSATCLADGRQCARVLQTAVSANVAHRKTCAVDKSQLWRDHEYSGGTGQSDALLERYIAMLSFYNVVGAIANGTVCMQFQHSLWDDLNSAELEPGGLHTHVGSPEASPHLRDQQVKSMPPGLTLTLRPRHHL